MGVKEGGYLEEKENELKEIDEVSKEVYVDVLSAMIHKAFSQDHRRLTEQSVERKDEFWVAEFKTHIARMNDQECKILLKKGKSISGCCILQHSLYLADSAVGNPHDDKSTEKSKLTLYRCFINAIIKTWIIELL